MMQSKYFRTCFGIIALLLIIYLGAEISFLFRPIVSMFNMLIVPVAMAGFFYYLLRPIVDYLERRKNQTIHRRPDAVFRVCRSLRDLWHRRMADAP